MTVGRGLRTVLVSHSSALHGGEKMCLQLALHLDRLKLCEVLLVTPGAGPLTEAALAERLKVRVVEERFDWYLGIRPDKQGIIDNLTFVGPAVRKLDWILRDFGAEVVVVNTLTNVVGTLAAARAGVPVVLWCHGVLDSGLFQAAHPLAQQAFDRILLGSAERVVCPSAWTACFFEQHHDVHPTVIPNFTVVPNPAPPWPAAPPIRYCCLNTINPAKDHETLLKALGLVRARGVDAELDLFGTGAGAEGLRASVARKGLEDAVRFHGSIRDVHSAYASAHCLVSASVIESFGMTLIEAMAHARPVIVADAGGHREILERAPTSGFICPPGDVDAFAERMIWIAQNPVDASRMGQSGRRAVIESFEPERSTRAFHQVLQGAASEPARTLAVSRARDRLMLTEALLEYARPPATP